MKFWLKQVLHRMSNLWLKWCRQPDLYESPTSSEYSTGSTLTPYTTAGKTEQNQVEVGELHEDVPNELQSVLTKEQSNTDECEKGIISFPNVTQGNKFS